MQEVAYCTKCGGDFERDSNERWRKLCLPCYKQKKRAEETSYQQKAPPPPPQIKIVYRDRPIPKDILDRLIRLCHPDKHDNSEMATKITQWLLEQR
jgi:hypothetical protein